MELLAREQQFIATGSRDIGRRDLGLGLVAAMLSGCAAAERSGGVFVDSASAPTGAPALGRCRA